jgi:RimJ/RimL family protein N-acetyltransferase
MAADLKNPINYQGGLSILPFSKRATLMTTKPNLTGTVVLLRNPEPRDVADRLALGLDPTIVHLFGVDPAARETIPALSPPTAETVEQWMDAIAKTPHSWIIEHEGRFLGDVHLRANALDRLAARAELAISLYDTKKLGLGLGRETVRLVLQYAFGSLQLHRVGLRVASHNARAIRCYLACGFLVEGRAREAHFVAGERYDEIIMGILAREFHDRAVAD